MDLIECQAVGIVLEQTADFEVIEEVVDIPRAFGVDQTGFYWIDSAGLCGGNRTHVSGRRPDAVGAIDLCIGTWRTSADQKRGIQKNSLLLLQFGSGYQYLPIRPRDG
jgi:hypothetical protein